MKDREFIHVYRSKGKGENMIKVGQLYQCGSQRFILAMVNNNQMVLINLQTGNRWVEPVPVANVRNVHMAEWKHIANGLEYIEQIKATLVIGGQYVLPIGV